MSDQTAVAAHVPALGAREIDLGQYQPEKYQVLARQEDLAAVAPILRADVAIVKIDARDVKDGGETHRIGGQFVPARSAIDKVGDAAGVTFDARLCGTRKEGPRLWVGRAVGRRRNPDSSWRTVSGEYEWDVDVREAEARDRLEAQVRNGKIKPQDVAPRLAAEVQQMMKFGRARADTGARLRVIRMLTGMKTAFARGELDRPFVLARFSVNAEALMADPDMRQRLVDQALGGAAEVYGPPREPRNVTPGRPEVDAPDPDVLRPDEPSGHPAGQKAEAAEFVDDIPWDEPAEEIARRGLRNCLEDKRLPAKAIAQINDLLGRPDDATVEQMEALHAKVTDWLSRYEAAIQ